MLEALQFEFMRNALWAGLLASVACGIIGTLVVVNRIVFISGGIAHAAYGGVGIAFFLGISPTFSAAVFSLVIAAVMATVTLRNKQRADTIIGVLWALGMAVGIILIDLTSGYRVDVMSYLFGSILAAFFYNGFLAMSFDEEFAQTMGVPVKTLYFILLGLMALSVVMVIRVVGLILVIALLTIPPYIAEKFSVSLAWMMVFSTILSCIFSFTGLWLSYAFNLTSGATVILVASLFFFVSLLWGRARVST